MPLSGKGAPIVDYKHQTFKKIYFREWQDFTLKNYSVSQKQRELSLSIKRARNLALL